MALTAAQAAKLDSMCMSSQEVKIGTEIKRIGDLTTNMSLAELAVIDAVTAGTVAPSKAVVVDVNKDVGDFRNLDAVNIDAGVSGTAGSVDVFPATASKGKLAITCDDQTGDTTVTLKPNAMGQATTVNIGDPGASASYFMQATTNVVGITATAVQLNEAGDKASSASRLYNLGAPVLADVDRIVTTTNMVNAAYTIAAQPDVPRNATVTVTAGATADTMGTIIFDGTDYQDNVIQEVITPVAGSTVAGALAFKSYTAVTGAGWVIDAVEGTNDTITVGVGNELGIPIALDLATEMIFGILGTTITAHNPTVADPATISGTTIDMSAGTYDGTKEALIFIVD